MDSANKYAKRGFDKANLSGTMGNPDLPSARHADSTGLRTKKGELWRALHLHANHAALNEDGVSLKA